MIIPARQPGEPANAAICDLMGLAYQRIRTEEDEVNWTNRITVPLQDLIGRFDESTVFQRFPWTDDNKWLLRGPYYGEETYKHLKNGFLGLQWKYNKEPVFSRWLGLATVLLNEAERELKRRRTK